MTNIGNTRTVAILIIGDIVTYFFSLVLTLIIRYGDIPGRSLIAIHAPAFALLIVVFIIINFSAGSYERQSNLARNNVIPLLLKSQIVNALIGIAFFYFAPVAIAPKANLFIYMGVSTAVLLVWRRIMFPVFNVAKKETAILVGSGDEISDIKEEVNSNSQYGLNFKEVIAGGFDSTATSDAIAEAVKKTGATVIVADLNNRVIESAMPYLYSLIYSGVQIVDAGKMYELIFDRVPLSMVGDRWFVEHSSSALGNRRMYDSFKRVIDVFVAFVGGVVSLIFYPFVILAIKFEDKGDIFIVQNRIGKDGKPIKIVKFRSMTGNDEGNYDQSGMTKFKETTVGSFLRKSRIDEVPQFWNVLKGDLSMVGPRPELPNLVSVYEKQIQYYNARHLVKPGLFGWAQIYHEAHPHHAVATEDTKDKLSYDLFYIKNRSLAVDLKIILRTMQILMKRVGR